MADRKGQKTSRISLWLGPELYAQVRAKAREEAVNLSALLRHFLRDWVTGKGRQDADD